MKSHGQDKRRRQEKKVLLIIMAVPLILLGVNILFLLKIETQVESANNKLLQLSEIQREDSEAVSGELKEKIPEKELPEGEIPEQEISDKKTQEKEAVDYFSEAGNIGSVEVLDYVSMCGLTEVDKPVVRSQREVLAKLGELAQDNAVIARIFKESDTYPERLLEALANNPEMADFVDNYHERKGKAEGGLTDLEKQKEYPLFLQWDPRWGYAEYGDESNVGLSGCGPTCLSMVLYYLTKDETLTPNKIAAYSMENGYYMSGTGTLWALLEELPLLYGVEVGQPETDKAVMESELDRGNILICSMGAGDFTTGGHFIVIYGYDEAGFHVNDSNCVARSRKSWSFKQIEKQIKHIWSFGKG